MLDFLLHNWLVFNVLSALSVGIFGFTNIITVRRGHDTNLSLLFLYINQVIISFLLFLLFGKIYFDVKLFLVAVISATTLALTFKSRFIALKGLDSSGYFINFRVFSSSMLLIIGVIFFGDTLSWKEYVGFFIGLIIFWLLFKRLKSDSSVYRKSLLFLFASIGLITLYGVILKIISVGDYNVFNFLFYQSVSALFVVFGLEYRKIIKALKNVFEGGGKKDKLKEVVKMSFIQAVLQILSLPLFLYALRLGADLGIAYKVQSYSILVPIILSTIVYKEEITLKKKFAFVLVIISLWFFV